VFETVTVALIVLLAFAWGLYRIMGRLRPGAPGKGCGTACGDCGDSMGGECHKPERTPSLIPLGKKTDRHSGTDTLGKSPGALS